MSGLAAIAGVEALVVGDVMLDEYVWGRVERISPEAPVPVVEVRDTTRAPGGAANAAAGVVALGCSARLIGLVGADEAAAGLRTALAEGGVSAEDLVVDEARATTVKTRVIAHAQQVVRTDYESLDRVGGEIETDLIASIRRLMESADVLILSDYGKGVVGDDVAAAAIAAAAELDKPIVVDSKGRSYEKFRGATVLTPTVQDAGRAANVRIEGDEDLAEAATRLSQATGGAALLVTRGAAGMSLFWDGEPLHIPTEAREVYDVTGAGDTVVAVLGAALGAGLSLPDAVRQANAAAGIVVGKVGTSTVSLAELEERGAGA
jgi:D-beta-D-heptose 7-phosphate kinase/D-beta-D-heptose 1-phosphate adenosyltransferase